MEVNGMKVVDRLLKAHGRIAEDEVWVHGMWTVDKWVQCIKAKLRGKKLVRMTHGSLSPIYLEYQGKWKKKLVASIEKCLFKLADKIVFTGEWEAEWFKAWMKGQEGKFEVVDLKEFFNLGSRDGKVKKDRESGEALRVMYLGRRHPLKGVEYLEKAVREAEQIAGGRKIELRMVSDHSGEELEKDWQWCEVMCLPTLSDNFGLVVAEALERGKTVITTDGAPAWEDFPGLIYLKGYRDGSEETKVKLLVEAIRKL